MGTSTPYIDDVHVRRKVRHVRGTVVNVTPTPRAAQRERLSREVVAARGLALADAEGLDALTVRRLAQDLGVTPMALYWHFADKDALLAGVADQLLQEVVPPAPVDGPWSDRLQAELGALLVALTGPSSAGATGPVAGAGQR